MSDLVATFFHPQKKETNMRQLRLLIISTATICVFTLAAFALVNRPPVNDPDDEIIIKGGSLEIQCGKKLGTDCLGANDNKGKYKAKNANLHITNITIREVTNSNTNANMVLYSSNFSPAPPPQIEITYCDPGTAPGTCKPTKY